MLINIRMKINVDLLFLLKAETEFLQNCAPWNLNILNRSVED